jgi:hypothetical protein
VACLVAMVASTTINSGFLLGCILALGIAATTLASVFLWESKSLRLFLIDLGYPALGIIIASLLLSVWR